MLAAAEAMIAARRADAVVVADDFGDRLDAGAAEYLAGELRRACAQLWLSTRRPETARAFPVTEVARVTRHGGRRQVHQVSPPADRSELSGLAAAAHAAAAGDERPHGRGAGRAA